MFRKNHKKMKVVMVILFCMSLLLTSLPVQALASDINYANDLSNSDDNITDGGLFEVENEIIEGVTISNLPKAELGNTIQGAPYSEEIEDNVAFDIEVPDDANYTATGCWYVEYYENGEFNYSLIENDTVVESRKKYILSVYILPKGGYKFSESVTITVDGENEPSYCDKYSDFIFIDYEYSFYEIVEEVYLTTRDEPEIDESLSNNTRVSIPENVNYRIETQDCRPLEDITANVFQAGKAYQYNVYIYPADGCEFADNVRIYWDDKYVTENFVQKNGSEIIISKQYSFKTVITEVSVEIPKIVIGETAPSEAKVPEGAAYTAKLEWLSLEYSNEEEIWNWYDFYNKEFSSEGVYAYRVIVTPLDSIYVFSEMDMKFILDGAVCEGAEISSSKIRYIVNFADEEHVVKELYLKVEVEEEPVIGEVVGDAPSVGVEDASEYIDKIESIWVKKEPEGRISRVESGESFIEGDSYGVGVQISLCKGYYFADDAIIVINDTVLSRDEFGTNLSICTVNYFFDYETQIIQKELTKADISPALYNSGYTSVEEINTTLQEKLKTTDESIEDFQLYEIELQYSKNGGDSWEDAEKEQFPADGKLLVEMPVPDGTSGSTHTYKVAHMFSENAFGKKAGEVEFPAVTIVTKDGEEYLQFYVTGLSPIMIGWSEITNNDTDDDNNTDTDNNGGTDDGGTDNGDADNGDTDNGGADNGGTDNGGTNNGDIDNSGTGNQAQYHTVTYMADDIVVVTLNVQHGENVAFPRVPEKEGYVGKWDRNNENITSDTVIHAVYTKVTDIVPKDLSIKDKTYLEETKKNLEEMLKDAGYPEEDKKAIQEAIHTIDEALEKLVQENEENYAKAPETYDNSILWIWVILMFTSMVVSVLAVVYRKREER